MAAHHRPNDIEIKEQLGFILNSPDFASSDRLKSFLEYVVEETLNGRGDQIKAYNVAVDVFDLGLDFDSSLNPSIRVAAGRLRNKLEHYYFTSANPDKIKITIPKGSYLPHFSYIPSTRPRGKTQEEMVELPQHEQLVSPYTGRHNEDVHGGANRAESRPTVIVLPFKSISADSNLEEFLVGLSEEIAIALTRFDELSVVNIQPNAPTMDPDMDIWKTAARIGARFIVGGSAQVGGEPANNLRLRIYLMDSTNQTQVWAERFDGALSNVCLFEIQDEITEQVAARIGDSFGLINRMLLKEKAEKSPADLKVYEAMLYYHNWLGSLTPERFIVTRNILHRAIELDPGHATTKAMLSDLYASHYQWGLRAFTNNLELSLSLANEAVELDSNCQYAHWAKAYNCYLRRDEKLFLESVYRSLELNYSNTNILATSGKKLAMIGQSDEGLEMLSKALRLNPHIPSWYRSAPFIVHFMHQEYEQALSEAKYITTPNFMWGPLMRAAAYGMLGQKEEGKAELEALLAIEPQFKVVGADAMLLLFFQPQSVEKMLEGLKKAGL